jgi:hypothetical protein
MNATELRDVFLSAELKQELEQMSSYLASIMQERPIVNLLAKCLWQRGKKFELEDRRHDLSINGKGSDITEPLAMFGCPLLIARRGRCHEVPPD